MVVKPSREFKWKIIITIHNKFMCAYRSLRKNNKNIACYQVLNYEPPRGNKPIFHEYIPSVIIYLSDQVHNITNL